MMNRGKKKLLIVNNNLELGGVQRSLINLLGEVENMYHITLFLFSNTGAYKDMVPSGVQVIEAKAPLNLLGISQKDSRSKGLFFYLLRAVLSAYTRMVNNHLPIRFLVQAQPKLKGFDVAISFLHDYEGKILYGGGNDFVLHRVEAKEKVTFLHCDFLKCGSNTRHARKSLKKFHKVAAVSDSCKKNFLKAMPSMADRTFCVYNCHNFQEYHSKSNEDPVVYGENCFNVLTVARLDEGKGILRTMEAVKALVGEGFKLRWHIVGDGVLRKTVERLVADQGLKDHVVLYGNQPNPYRYMKNADLFLLPSYHEAAPMVFLEAKSLGLPVLTTETLSAREMIADHKEGFICTNSKEGIYQGLRHLLSNPSELEYCREYLEGKKFSNENAIHQFDSLIR